MLIIPPFQFAHCTSSLGGTPPAALVGTAFSTTTANIDGTAVTAIGTAVSHDIHYVVVGLATNARSGFANNSVVDVLYDPAGGTSWSELISDLVVGFCPVPSAGSQGIHIWYHFPLYVPAGATFGLRARSEYSPAETFYGIIYCYGCPNRPDAWWCGTKVETIGVSPSPSTLSTAVTPGASGVWGSWTDVGSVTSARFGAIQLGLSGSDSSMLARGYYWQMGSSTIQLPGTPTLYSSASTVESIARTGFCFPIWCDIPQGTQLQVRGTCSAAGEAHYFAYYGVY